MKKCLHIYYNGQVQGVGFRFTAERLANKFGLTGFVKNLYDGRVEVIAEGEEEALKKFQNNLKLGMNHYISSENTLWENFTGEFKDFSIRF